MADAINDITGVDYSGSYPGTYRMATGSIVALRENGHETLEHLMTSELGEPINKNFLKRGDAALFDNGHGLTVGVCVGVDIIAPGEHGIEWVPMSACHKGWPV